VLSNLQAQNFIMQERIKQLEIHIEGDDNGEVIRGDKTYTNRGVQVKPPKQKDRDA